MKWRVVFLLIGILGLAASCKQDTTAKRQLLWAEEFEGTALDLSQWNYKLGNGCPDLCGWGNNEPQFYNQENTEVSNGTLKITATLKDAIYNSSRLTTEEKFEFKYGRVETRVKLPQGQGLWPAVWMLGSNIKKVGWPKCGEIDIVEWIGRDPDSLFTSLHTQSSHGNTINTRKSHLKNNTEWHTYACDWKPDSITFYLDDVEVYSYAPTTKNEDTFPFTQPFYLLVNMAVGGNFGGEIDDSVFPQTLEVDYIRVYSNTTQQ